MNADEARINMITQQFRTQHVLEPSVLTLLVDTPREKFVPKGYEQLAFADTAIPLGKGRAMMPPAEEARLLQELQVQPTERVLLLGVLSGYLLALLAKQSLQLYGVDDDQSFLDDVKQKAQEFKLNNVTFMSGGLSHGWQEHAPFDVIVLSGSVPSISESLLQSLTVGGRLYAVVGGKPAMKAMLINRVSDTSWHERQLFETIRPRCLDAHEPSQFVF